MSGARNSDASAIAALALAFHRSPAKYPELIRGTAPLPSSIAVLLRLAGGTALREVDPALESLAPESGLRLAALFFIEQMLFQRDASHYRVLGLNQDATSEQIKEHHRLLMRLFHPDRESPLGARREQFATRANLAYNTLRDADSRARYDSTLKPVPAAPAQPPHRAPAIRRRRMAAPESFWSVSVHPLLMRYLPQWVLAGTALVSVTIVGAVYVFNPPVQLPRLATAPGAESGVETSRSYEAAPDAALEPASDGMPVEEAAAQFERRVANAQQTLERAIRNHEAADAGAMGHAQATPALVKAAGAEPAPAAPKQSMQKPAAAAPVATNVAPPMPAQEMPLPLAPASKPEAVPLLPAAVAAITTPAPEAGPASPPVALPGPDRLFAQFLQAYGRADIQGCMELLDENLRADAGGKPELRREYDALFRSTDLRHVRILTMRWSQNGDAIRGEGHYRLTLMRKGETLMKSEDGQVIVTVVRRGNAALIKELHYLADNPS